MFGGLFKKPEKKKTKEKQISPVVLDGEIVEDLGIDAIPKDNEQIEKLADKKVALLDRVSEIDSEIIAIQRSTRTNIRFLAPAHNSLRMRFKWYYKWHLHKYASIIHYLILIAYIILLSATFIFASSSGWSIAKLFRPDQSTAAATNINISGACKQYDRSTNCADSEAIKVAVNGTLSGVTTSTSGGTWTLTGVTVNNSDIVTVFIDNVADANEAVAIAKVAASAADISGVALYERHVTVGASTNLSLSNANLGQYDNSVSTDEDIFFEVDASSNLTLPATSTQTAADQILYVVGDNTYRPDLSTGRTNTMPNLNIASGATLTGDNNTFILTAAGTPFVKTGTLGYDTSTIRYTGAGNTSVTAANYYNLETKPSAGTGASGWTVTGAGNSAYNGDYNESGTYGSGGKPAYTNGSKWIFSDYADMPMADYWCMYDSKQDLWDPWMQCAYYSASTDLPGTWYAGEEWSGGTAPAPTVSTLVGGYTYTFASGTFNIYNNYINGDDTHGVSTNLTTNDPTLNIDGSYTNAATATFVASNSATFSVGGNFTNSQTLTHSSGTLTFDGSSTQSITMGSSSLNNLVISNTSGAVSQASAVALAGTLTVNSSAIYNIDGQNITLATLSNSGTFRLQGGETTVTITNKDTDSGTIEYTGSGTYTSFKYANAYFDLKLNGSGSWTPNGDVTANSINIAAGTLNGSSRNITLSGSGTPFTVSGTFTSSTSTVIYTGTTATNITAANYTNLKVNQSGTTFTAAGNINASGVLTIQAGTFDASNRIITLTGSGTPFVKTGTLTASSSTFKYTGTGSVTVAAADYFNLETSSAGAAPSGWSVTGAGDSTYNGTYTASSTFNSQSTYTNGSRWLYYNYDDMGMNYSWIMYSSVVNLMDAGMSAGYYDGATLPGTWYENWMYGNGPAPTVSSYSASNTFTLASGTINVGGNYTAGDGTNTIVVNADTNDPTLNINGNLAISANATLTASASGVFSVGANYTNSGSFVDSSGTLTLDGADTQTITASGTDATHNFYNLTVTNASLAGVTFADSLTLTGTFTDVTASSKLTFTSGATYTFPNISINGQGPGSRIVMTGSGTWNFNVSQSSPSASYVNVTNSNASGGNEIDASVGSVNGTGNTNWSFTGSTVTVSGTVYTAENKSANIGENKTIALSINGDTATTVKTSSGGVFEFTNVSVSTNLTVAVFIDGETEKGSLVTQAANNTSSITGLELFTSHIVLTYNTSGPMTNTILATADNVADSDLLVSVDGSSNVTFTSGKEVWILGGKAYTPGGNVTAGSLEILATGAFSPEAKSVTFSDSGTPFTITGTFNEGTSTLIFSGSTATNIAGTTYHDLEANQAGTTFTAAGNITVSGVFTIRAGTFDASDKTITLTGAGTPFVKSGTLTPSTSTFKYTGAEATTVAAADYYHLETVPASAPAGGGGWTVTNAGDSSYNGSYTASGTMNGKDKYTNGSRWLFYNYAMMMDSYHWGMYSSASDCGDPSFCLAYYQWPSAATPPGTWYPAEGYSGTPSFAEAASSYVYTLSAGTFNIGGNYTNGTASVIVETNATTNDPTISIDGNFSNLAGSTFIASNSAAFGVASNYTNAATGKFTDSGGTITLDGQGLQTITAGGTSANFDFTNLIVTNASAAGVEFADSVTVTGTFTDVIASSKITFHSGSTYAFNAININGQETGTKITLTSSSSGTAWNLNITAASPTASYVTVKDSNANKDIDATTGGYDNTGNTHWLFPVSVYVSGTVFTAENKGSNIGANKTVALSINGGTKVTDETDASGVFRFDDVTIGTNNPITLFLDAEEEKASLVTIAANGTSAISSLEMFTNRIVLSHASAGPMSNTVLATADNACTTDCLFSVDGSSVATFTAANEVFVQTTKSYTPGAAVILDDIEVDGTLTLASNALTVSGSWDATGGNFSSSGTVTFNSGSPETIITGGIGGSGGYTVSGTLSDNSYTGTYTASGTMNGQPKYTNGSKWLFYNLHGMPEPGYEWALSSSASDCMDTYMCTAYYQYPSSTNPASGTWYAGMDYTGTPTLAAAPSGGGTFTNLTKSGAGVLQASTDEVKIDGTLSIGSNATFDLNGQELTLATLSNDGTFKLQGAEAAVTITNMDTNSGLVEYVGSGTYTSLKAGNSYYNLKINGSGGSFSPNGTVTIANDLDVSAGTLAGTQSINVNGGDATGNGTVNLTGGTFLLDGTGNFGGTTNWSFYNLTFGDTSGTATSTKTSTNQVTATNVLTIAANQTLDAGDDTWVLTGPSTPFVKTGTFTASTSTVKYTGAGDTTIAAATYYNLETSPSASGAGGFVASGATNATAFNDTYLANGTNDGQTAYQGQTGLKWLYYCTIYSHYMLSTNKSCSPAREYEGGATPAGAYGVISGVAPAPTVSAGATSSTYTFASGTININGNYINGDGSHNVTTTADTNDPTLNIDGNFTNSANATFTASATGNFSVASNFTNSASAVFTHSSGTITFDGQGSQSVTAGGDPFNNVTVSNTAAAISQSDGSTIASTLTINSGAVYDINGQNITLATLSNSGTFRLQGGETTVAVTNKDTDSGTVEYNGSGTYASLKYGNSYYDLKINGAGGTWTLGANLGTHSIIVTSGGLIDNGKNVTISGNIDISSGENALVSTGIWTMTASGDIKNGDFDSTYPPDPDKALVYNSIYDFRLADGVTARRTYYFNVRKLTMGNGSAITSDDAGWYLRVWLPYQDNFISFTGDYSISGANTVFYSDQDNIRGQGAITLGENLLVGYLDSGTIKMLGNWNVTGTLDVSGNYFSINETTAAVLDTNGYNLNISGNVKIGHSSRNAENRWMGKIMFSSGTHTISGSLYTPDINTVPYEGQVGGYTHGYYDFSTSNVYIGGNLLLTSPYTTVSAGTATIHMSATTTGKTVTSGGQTLPNLVFNGTGGVWTLQDDLAAASITISNGVFNASSKTINLFGNFLATGQSSLNSGTSSVNLVGESLQEITSAGAQFYNLSSTNYSSSGVSLKDSITVNNLFTAITPNNKITFNSGSTYSFNAININGQETGTKVILISSNSGTPWNLNITASSPVASYVSVKDSNANKDIDATTGGYDGTGNTHWLFPVSSSTPVNNSLTFTNPYSSNVAISDNTVEWNFQAVVSDADGVANLNYVEFRLANDSDATQPYDSVKVRWTESSGAFSEIADTQNAVADIASSSSSASGTETQKTINFKLKINSNFTTEDTNYAAELYSVDDSATSDTDNYSNIYQVDLLSLNLSVDSATFDFGSLLPGSVITGTTVTTVTTNYPNGYSLSAHDGVSGSNSALLHSDSSTRINDYTGTIGLPTLWSGNGLGICVFAATGKDTGKWGTGTTAGDSGNKYAGVPETANIIHSKTGSPTASNQTSVGYKLVVSNDQKTGAYSGIITYTGTGVLN